MPIESTYAPEPSFTYKPVDLLPKLPGSPLRALQPLQPVTPPPVNYPNTYDWGNCTWFVASRINVPDNLGNANMWAVNAAADGYTVSSIPRIGAVAQTSRGALGHVAIVTGISGGMVTVDQMNVLGLGVENSQTEPVSDFSYIYF